jgi:uncharacterized protein YtpQ (UPF0354 family)
MTKLTPKTSKAIAYLKAAVPNEDEALLFELSDDDSPVLKDIGKDLQIAYLVDTGNTFEYVRYIDLAYESLTESALHEIGLQNLATLAASGNLRVIPHCNIFAVLLDGNFEASMILLDNLWIESFRQFVRGDYLIAMPTRDVLAFCDSSLDIGRSELLALIERLRDSEDHLLTKHLFIRHDHKWTRENSA